DAAVQALVKAEVIKPWDLTVTVESKPTAVTGLHRVYEDVLNGLADEAFLELRPSGAIPLAYMHLWSMAQVSRFEQLSQMQNQLSKTVTAQSAAEMEELFQMIDPE